ncbi:carbohydrate ABC transporter permease [Microlunatus soli]|uniref:Multiple sugar transport system permease protein n=1 Tax=Microlunatus soli TaxID=630515 RepID=A0A1H1Z124_9ACTN|nr:sugar ABC transporter permease [Microlunatus soli]SDT26876.1 multiple sugar transport system permease protein [Microlunatus soli]
MTTQQQTFRTAQRVGDRPRPGRRRRRRGGATPYLFIAPFMLIFLAMLVVPLIFAGYLSLFTTKLATGTEFVGLVNYAEALTDPAFLGGVGRMIHYLLVQVPVMLVLSMVAALVLDSGLLRFPKLFRILIFIPFAVPAVVGAVMWGYLYGAHVGPFAQLAQAIGWPAPGFLTRGGIVYSIANIAVWEFVGYNMIIFYAALKAIPPVLYEAAAIDGAGPIRTALYVKVPQLLPALFLTALFSLIGSFQLFNEPNVLTPLAPTAIGRDWTPNLYAYNLAFVDQRVEYASAISFVLGAVIAVASIVFMLITTRLRRRTA